MSLFSLNEQDVLITGASSGFGEHFATLFARNGCRTLALLARRTDRLEELASQLRKEIPNLNVVAVKCDVSDTADIPRAFDEAVKLTGVNFNVIVNNAGIGSPKSFLNHTNESYNQIMDVNVRGCFFVAQEGAKRMVESQIHSGSIINIASIYGSRVGYGHTVYSSSKAALIHMTKAQALELMEHGIRVNCVLPGYFKTELTQDFYDGPKGKDFIQQHIPINRLGNIGELDGVMLLLGSQASSFMYGSIVTVDGGHLLSTL